MNNIIRNKVWMLKIILLTTAWVSISLLTGCGASEADICETAAQLISEKYASWEGSNAPTCTAVRLGKMISQSSWHATALLSNGETIPVIVEIRGDMVGVDLSEQIYKEYQREMKKATQEFERDMANASREFKRDMDNATQELQREIDAL
ncbi:MAG: hypothetical protein PHS41_01525 [Victivallaceae bacterium]|nr:hypothetical protein [Victivallaceae bacterium]